LNTVQDAPISAFTARQNARSVCLKILSSQRSTRLFLTCSGLHEYQETIGASTAISEISQEVLVTAQPVESEVEETIVTGSSISRAASPETVTVERSTLTFSTFVPNGNNIKELKNGTIALRLAPGEVISHFQALLQLLTYASSD